MASGRTLLGDNEIPGLDLGSGNPRSFQKVLGTAPVRSGSLDVNSVSLGSVRQSPFSMAKVGGRGQA